MENPEGLQKRADGAVGQLNGKVAEVDQSRAGLKSTGVILKDSPWKSLLTIASHPKTVRRTAPRLLKADPCSEK